MTNTDNQQQDDLHTMTVEWDSGAVTYRVKCSADAQAPCRFDFDCECEAYIDTGIDPEHGPWHSLVEGYMTSEQDREFRETGGRPRHFGKFGGECTYALWINDSDIHSELGLGPVTFPIDVEWDGYDCTWSPR